MQHSSAATGEKQAQEASEADAKEVRGAMSSTPTAMQGLHIIHAMQAMHATQAIHAMQGMHLVLHAMQAMLTLQAMHAEHGRHTDNASNE